MRTVYPDASAASILAAVGTLAAGAGPATPQEQPDVLLRDEACDGCVVAITPGTTWNGDWVDQAGDLELLADGVIAFIATTRPELIALVSPTGDSLGSIGRLGEGPGEYEFIRFIRSHTGLLHVFDLFHRRRTVLDSEFNVVHTNPLLVDQLWDVQILTDSLFVGNAAILTRDRVGYALHAFDSEGVVVRSFDEPVSGFGGVGSNARHRRVLGLARNGKLWAAYTTEYRIDLWSADTGTLAKSLVREAEWFPAHLGGPTNDRLQPPAPRVIGLVEDAQGLLWVMIRKASDRWIDAFAEVPPNSHPELGSHYLEDLSIAYDTVIEVIDHSAGVVIASVTVDPALAFLKQGLASAYSEDDAGIPHRQIWRLDLVRD